MFRDFFWLDRSSAIEGFRPTKNPDFLDSPDYSRWGLPLLNYYKVRYIILYPQALKETGPDAFGAAENMVKRALGQNAQPVYKDDKLWAYRVPEAPSPTAKMFIDTGSQGWYPAEKAPNAPAYRWADSCNNPVAQKDLKLQDCANQPGELLVFNLGQAKNRARIQFTVFNYKEPRTINIAINGFQAQSFRLEGGATKDVTLDLDIPPGLNKLTISSPELPVPVGQPSDNRLLSFGLNQVRLAEIK
jgi:hypothetical protein